MRTTVRLEERLLREAKQLALRTGRTLTDVVEEALRESLQRRRRRAAQPRAKLPTFGVGGLQPGVDLDDTASLLDVMEAERR